MCGIAGLLTYKSEFNAETLASSARRMTDALRHRGPNDAGIWCDPLAGIALGHRRLAILDLSPDGHQPMLSPSGRYVIVFNGEIYNYRVIKNELSAVAFRSHSDTEVMLAAFDRWGVEASLSRMTGMFAFALWDRSTHELILARDRFGEKPLYYGCFQGTLLFASELKALRRFPGWHAELDRSAITSFMRHGFIPAPHSIYRGIYKLIPGAFLRIQPGQLPQLPPPIAYWSAQQAAESALARPFQGTPEDAISELQSLLLDSVASQMMSDVPLGAFLSGGIDSSAIVAMMQAQSSRPVRTFTIGFSENAHNEAPFARAVARHLGTDHTEHYVTPSEAQAVVARLPEIYDEPFADSSQIPTYLVSRLASRHVTVSLSGDAGDELFCGYDRYPSTHKIWNSMAWMPHRARVVMSKFISGTSPNKYDIFIQKLGLQRMAGLQRLNGDRLHKLAEMLYYRDFHQLYYRAMSYWDDSSPVVLGAGEAETVFNSPRTIPARDLFHYMMFLDTSVYLPDDILVKVDRAAMAVSLETRVPLLDHRIFELAWRLPLSLKYQPGASKWILRQILYKYVPRHLLERPKMGFGVPIADWLRGPLRTWAEDLLNEAWLAQGQLLNPQAIRRRWHEHLLGVRNWHYYLWPALMLQEWLAWQSVDR